MTPGDFLRDIVEPNVREATGPANMRAAVNAVLSLDALAGIVHAYGSAKGVPEMAQHARDDGYREALSQRDPSFRLVRDLAAALKHGALSDPRKKGLPRLVSGAGAIASRQIGVPLGGAPVGSHAVGGGVAHMWIAHDESPGGDLAGPVIGRTHALLSAIVADLP